MADILRYLKHFIYLILFHCLEEFSIFANDKSAHQFALTVNSTKQAINYYLRMLFEIIFNTEMCLTIKQFLRTMLI